MRNIISVLIIDPNKEVHNYTEVKVDKLWDSYEASFDIRVYDNAKDVLRKLDDFRGVDCIITIGNEIDCSELNALSFEFRKKWIHKDEFNARDIAYSILAVFSGNIKRKTPDKNKLFSLFTCTFNTGEKVLNRLYTSIKKQTYHDWNWFILDDSSNSNVRDIVKGWHDARIILVSNFTNHGNIGFNKHMAAMMCNGDYLVEVDHDDELLPNCLMKLKEAFDKFPDNDFVYSYVLEQLGDDESVWYGNEWGTNGWGGGYANFNIKGTNYKVALTSDITPISIRTIFTQPNHVRCWKKDFYHKIGGHNTELSVLDDAELLMRTFLNGKITKIPEVLYIQHESKGKREQNHANTQGKRYNEIQRTSDILKRAFDWEIHKHIIELGYKDCIWDDNMGRSILEKPKGEIQIMNDIL